MVVLGEALCFSSVQQLFDLGNAGVPTQLDGGWHLVSTSRVQNERKELHGGCSMAGIRGALSSWWRRCWSAMVSLTWNCRNRWAVQCTAMTFCVKVSRRLAGDDGDGFSRRRCMKLIASSINEPAELSCLLRQNFLLKLSSVSCRRGVDSSSSSEVPAVH